jgi:large conductance mechanosensitive channel protein
MKQKIKLKKQHKKLVQEFGEFINRGNVVDLAVGVIVGGAFSKIVTALVNNVITPIVGIVIGGVDLSYLSFTVPNWLGNGNGVTINYGNFLQSVIDFLIVALCIFIFVKLINKLKNKDDSTEKSDKKSSDNEKIIALLEKIEKKLK